MIRNLKTKKIKFWVGVFSLVVIFLGTFSVTFAIGDYTVLVPLPGIGESDGKTNLETYLPAAFNLAIAISAIMAFVMITFGGIMYATSDAISGKSQGREYVTDAIWGLLLVLGAYAILWTINPRILNFDLDVQQIDTTTPTATVSSGTVSQVRCIGNCPYSYTKSNGTIVSYKDCSSCSLASSFGLTLTNPTINGQPAQVNTSMGQKLQAAQNTAGMPSFRVTETWPPTVNHAAQGQYDGTSVDVSLSSPSAQNINTAINNFKNQGLRPVYEVSTEAQKQAYIAQGVNAANIISVGYITGEHFSIYPK